MNNGDYPVSLSYTAASSNAGWNLIGNPYPSALQWNDLWAKTDVGDWACVHFNGNDQCYNAATGTGWPNAGDMANGIIPPTQGFWVRATSASAALTIPQSERLHSNQSFYKGTAANIGVARSVRLRVDGNNDFDVVLFQFINGAQDNFDAAYDLEKRWGYAESPNIYSMVQDDQYYSVDARPVSDENQVYPVGLEVGANGIYSIKAAEFSGFEPKFDVFLEDRVENEFVELSEGTTYNFTADEGAEKHRFNLIIQKASSDIGEKQITGINIYSHGNEIYIHSEREIIEEVVIYNILGHENKRIVHHTSGSMKIPVLNGTGYYIVQVQTKKNFHTGKVLIK
jgi:hypothetical protein